jgi:hypothetical protein
MAAKRKHREAEIQRTICQYLSLRNIPHTRTDASRCWARDGKVMRGKVTKGWPDITAVLPGGKALFIEVKTKYGPVSPVQEVVIQRLRKQGAIAFVARCVDDVHRFFNGPL